MIQANRWIWAFLFFSLMRCACSTFNAFKSQPIFKLKQTVGDNAVSINHHRTNHHQLYKRRAAACPLNACPVSMVYIIRHRFDMMHIFNGTIFELVKSIRSSLKTNVKMCKSLIQTKMQWTLDIDTTNRNNNF